MAQTTQFTTTSAVPAPSYEASDGDAIDLATRVFLHSRGQKDRYVARRLASTSFGSPVRRSPRLSALPPPLVQGDLGTQDEQESDDDSDSVNDVAAHLSRDETPENDPLPRDEPSSILASKIMRAHDNPSPPPPNRPHSGTSHIPGKDGQFPLFDVPLPSDPFRDINLLERLMHGKSTENPGNLSATPGNNESESNDSRNIPPQDLISFDSCSGATESLPVDQASSDNSIAANSPHAPRILPSVHSTVDDLLSLSPGRFSTSGAHTDSAEQDARKIEEQRETELSGANAGSQSPQIVIPSLAPTNTTASNSPPKTPLRRSPWRSSARDSPAFTAATILESLNSEEHTNALSLCAGNEDALVQINGDGAASPSAGSGESAVAGKGRGGGRKIVRGDLNRELGSLSPQSTDVLSRLVTSTQPSATLKHPPLSTPSATQISPTSRHFSHETADWLKVVPAPRRPNGLACNPPSPLKFSFAVEDVTRSPARRVPIQDVFSNGTTPLQRAGQSAASSDLSFPKFRAPFLARPVVDPSRTPAKRVPVASSTTFGTTLGSPARPIPRARSASVDPKPLRPAPARSHSVEPSPTVPRLGSNEKESTFPKVSVIPRTGAKLPFPLASGQKSRSNLPDTIHEEEANICMDNQDGGFGTSVQSLVKSQLRQPSVGSRIPRIGAKPYTRPLPKDAKHSAITALKQPASSTSDVPLVRAGNINVGSDHHSLQTDNGQRSLRDSVAATLKRKRGPETVLSPKKSRPVTVHQNASDGFISNVLVPGGHASTEGSSQKMLGTLKFRKVVNGMLAARYAPTQLGTNEDLMAEPQPPSHPSAHSAAAVEELTERSTSPSLESVINEDAKDVPRPLQTHVDHSDTTLDTTGISSLSGSPEVPGHLRRTSRRRKLAQHATDVPGSSTRPLARRRPQSRIEADSFMGMSATELKALTTSNTTKNQQTVATFATEVIRREGHRPESPTTKARTILQKQREEKDTRRQERAERRARRGDSDTQLMNGQAKSDVDIEHDENINEGASRHRRGRGDEEDWETPEKPEHPFKRMRYDEGAGQIKPIKPIKQVQWHRGLPTVAYLDDLHPKPKCQPRDFVIGKGCLAPAAKNLQLDTLGNIVDIENRPLPELVPEHIVVKKFLYDNDIEPEPVPTRTTRSKSRKTKS